MDPPGSRGTGEPVPDQRTRGLAALTYSLGAFSGVILLATKKEDRFIQFHALQSIALTVLGLGAVAVIWLFTFFPILGFLYGMLLRLLQVGFFLYWLFLLWQAYRGRWYKAPSIGAWVERQLIP
jgi:uncharacterized membrane protein